MATQDDATRARMRRRVLLQIGLAVVAALLVLVVVDAVENGRDSIIPGLTDSFSGREWALMLLPFVFIILLVELYLLVTRHTNAERGEDPVAATMMFIGLPPPRGRTLLMGCHGCGTLFSHESLPNSTFACPNCGRTGVYRGSNPVTTPIQDKTCVQCNTPFEAYLPNPECPHCHAAQPV